MINFSSPLFLFGIIVIVSTFCIILFAPSCIIVVEEPKCEKDTNLPDTISLMICTRPPPPYQQCTNVWENIINSDMINAKNLHSVIMFDTHSKAKINVPFDDVKKTYYSGKAMLGETWNDVCVSYTTTDDNGCLLNTNLEDMCETWVENSNYFCLDLNIKPKTIPNCIEKYNNGYLTKDISQKVSLSSYVYAQCDIFDKTQQHGKDCNDWWIQYKEISKNDYKTINEEQFIIKYCLNESEPDWKSWGFLDLDGKITYNHLYYIK